MLLQQPHETFNACKSTCETDFGQEESTKNTRENAYSIENL